MPHPDKGDNACEKIYLRLAERVADTIGFLGCAPGKVAQEARELLLFAQNEGNEAYQLYKEPPFKK